MTTPTPTPTATAQAYTFERHITQGTYSVEANGRSYELPSATGALGMEHKEALMPWAAKEQRAWDIKQAVALQEGFTGDFKDALVERVGRTFAYTETSREATTIGSQAHHFIEWILRQRLGANFDHPPDVSPEALVCVNGFSQWAQEANLKPRLIEETVCSLPKNPKQRYAGTMDLYADVGANGVPTVVDFKSSKALYPGNRVQVAAYMNALKSMGHGEPQQGMVVRLSKDASNPGFEVQTVKLEEVPALMNVFYALLHVWHWKHPNKIPHD
jgi:hypothetical protein